MSKAKFDDKYRWAVWEAFGHACMYCKQQLRLSEVHLDHVIPERLKSPANKRQWSKLRKKLNLDDNFDIDGVRNISPSCAPCNLAKQGEPFDAVQCLIPLQKIARKKQKIERLRDQIATEQQADTAIAVINEAIRTGIYTRSKIISKLSAFMLSAHMVLEILPEKSSKTRDVGRQPARGPSELRVEVRQTPARLELRGNEQASIPWPASGFKSIYAGLPIARRFEAVQSLSAFLGGDLKARVLAMPDGHIRVRVGMLVFSFDRHRDQLTVHNMSTLPHVVVAEV